MTPPADVLAALRSLGIDDARIASLGVYVEVLNRWRQSINLIGPAGIDEIWRRHVLDSAQLWPHVSDPDAPILDLGAGAGLPGLILSILGARRVTLADSDQRKAAFLRAAAKACGVTPVVAVGRFDALFKQRPRNFQMVVGRAVAPLPRLLPTVAATVSATGFALLHKGKTHRAELTEAQKSWTMQVEAIPSITADLAVLLKIWEIDRRDD